MICPQWNNARKKNAVLVAHAAMTVLAVLAQTVRHLVALVARPVATMHLPMAVTNLRKPLVLTPTNPPFSASAR
jgi:hypothetical protein